MEKIKIQGLFNSAGWILFCWGIILIIKGFWDTFIGEPEANLYSSVKWDFISQKQWLTWASFEITYGLACSASAYILWKYAQRLPIYIERPVKNK